MENLHKDYIYLDGMWLKEEQLMKLAMNAGSMVVAEHYLCAYLTNALINGKGSETVSVVNKVRSAYGIAPLPETEIPENGNKRRKDSAADLARKKYTEMKAEKRQDMLRESLKMLLENHLDLFKSKIYWNGIFLVLRDRVDSSIRKSDFHRWVRKMIPRGWPDDLKIGESTLSNFAHYVEYSDRSEAYYDMESNPWADLCNTFWNILEQQILTSDLRENE